MKEQTFMQRLSRKFIKKSHKYPNLSEKYVDDICEKLKIVKSELFQFFGLWIFFFASDMVFDWFEHQSERAYKVASEASVGIIPKWYTEQPLCSKVSRFVIWSIISKQVGDEGSWWHNFYKKKISNFSLTFFSMHFIKLWRSLSQKGKLSVRNL